MQSLTKILIPRQLFTLLILSTGLLNHVILIPNLLTASGRDSWLSVLLCCPVALFFLWLVSYIVKNCPDEGFFSMVQNRFWQGILRPFIASSRSFFVLQFVFNL